MNQSIQYYPNFPDTQQNRAAISELIELIRAHYPEATFEVAPAPEDSQVVHLYATVDRIDTDELVDLVIAREVALQEQGVPIHVIPLRTPERNASAGVDPTCDLVPRPAPRASPTRPGRYRWCARENISTRRPSRSRNVRAEPSSRSTIGVSSTPSSTWSCH